MNRLVPFANDARSRLAGFFATETVWSSMYKLLENDNNNDRVMFVVAGSIKCHLVRTDRSTR
jgi:hypothetical protein